MENIEDLGYRRYTSKAEANKAFNTLCGIVEGIAMDNKINDNEIRELESWCENHQHLMHSNPFRDVISNIQSLLTDSDDFCLETIEDIKWLCEIHKDEFSYYKTFSSDLQILNGILHGIMADGELLDAEIYSLANWLENNQHLATYYPYDKIMSLVGEVLEDSKIDEDERLLLKSYFKDFIFMNNEDIQTQIESETKEVSSNHSYYSRVLKVEIIENQFCFTGMSSRNISRNKIKEVVLEHGGKYVDGVSSKTKYLIVGDMGNPAWAFASYGRKIEKAINLNNSKGLEILIIHEADFWKEIDS
ncbi:MAG: BRCT domain-containing protein [Bacteroidota bacterium]